VTFKDLPDCLHKKVCMNATQWQNRMSEVRGGLRASVWSLHCAAGKRPRDKRRSHLDWSRTSVAGEGNQRQMRPP
jgi:hypothetical protein